MNSVPLESLEADPPMSKSPSCDDMNVYVGATATSMVPLLPLPEIPLDKIDKQFSLTESNTQITSLDITAHGCYVLAGCSNGRVLLFDMTSPDDSCHLIAHIQAKGLHTNLLLSVKITEDCRFCYVGVQKGSSELLAIDLGKLPVNWNKTRDRKATKSSFEPRNLVHTYSRNDPKLRGFGAACRVNYQGTLNSADGTTVNVPAIYRLACGRGIKNIHVWQFEPDHFNHKSQVVSIDDSEAATNQDLTRSPKWTCIYDVASNGNTIETIAFRNGGMEALSKSVGFNLRVWDLSQFERDPTAKPTFEDVANSQDAKSFLDGYAFGGSGNFAIVKIAAPKAANRDSFEIPERSIEDGNGQRRKR